MPVRHPLVAGQFYEADPQTCREHVEALLADVQLPDLPGHLLGGIVPHAGWTFSGPLAATVFAAIARQDPDVKTFVLFGAVHSVGLPYGSVYDTGHWESPLGPVPIDEDLAAELLRSRCPCLEANPASHDREHSLEVQIPFIRHLFPDARILPIMVPPIHAAVEIGRTIAENLRQLGRLADTVCLGSTDLTHYGPAYGFMPAGAGPDALRWAKQENDQKVLDPILALKPNHIVDTTRRHTNACGGGAIAATVAAVTELTARHAVLLGHTTSAEIMTRQYGCSASDSVGYAAIVFS